MNYGSNQRRVAIKIDPLGRTTVEAQGFMGVGCEAATAPLEKALSGGNGVDVREFKPERYQEDQTAQVRENW